MTLSVLMSTRKMCNLIADKQILEINDIIDNIGQFHSDFVLDEEFINELYETLYQNKREDGSRGFSLFLDRRNRGRSTIQMNQALYEMQKERLAELSKHEAENIKTILYHKAEFSRNEHVIGIGEGDSMRWILTKDAFYQVMTLFGDGIEGLHEFTEFIKLLYKEVVFDSDIEDSMKRLEAGFAIRRHEILYHLYCIQKEIPQIIREYGMQDNQSLGEKMSIPCSPEKKRAIVDKKLTKTADNGKKITCELHTKMQKLGSQKPDRIYFCAKVPEGISVEGDTIGGKIYVYKITEHA